MPRWRGCQPWPGEELSEYLTIDERKEGCSEGLKPDDDTVLNTDAKAFHCTVKPLTNLKRRKNKINKPHIKINIAVSLVDSPKPST